MKDEEIEQAKANGVTPVEHTVASDGIAVIVHPSNAVADLTIEQIGKIYRGEITNWKEVGGADKAIVILSPVTRPRVRTSTSRKRLSARTQLRLEREAPAVDPGDR